MPEAIDALRQALEEAERLKHPPTLWFAVAALSECLFAAGDHAGAEAAFGRARGTIDAFTAGFSDPRKEQFLAAPQLAQLLAFSRLTARLTPAFSGR